MRSINDRIVMMAIEKGFKPFYPSLILNIIIKIYI